MTTSGGLLGDQIVIDKSISVYVFHDEREIPNKWLYHGFLYISAGELSRIREKLHQKRNEIGYDDEIKFRKLRNTNKINQLAIDWVKIAIDEILGQNMWFYFFGVNYTKLNKEVWSHKRVPREFKIYNKFFQIGLYGSIKWFFGEYDICIIEGVFSDRRNLPSGDAFAYEPIEKIFLRTLQSEAKPFVNFRFFRIAQINSNHKMEPRFSSYSHFVQLVDLLVGGFSQIYDATSKDEGKCKIAELLLNKGLPHEIMGYGKQHFDSKYYKKVCVSFFPRDRLDKNTLLEGSWRYMTDQFYNIRQSNFIDGSRYPLFNLEEET
jgi:hypothetical protein